MFTNTTEQPDTMKKPQADAAPTRKFMFDLSFDDAAIVHRAAERKPVLMKPEQVDALKQESYDQGFEAGKAAGLDAQAAALADILSVVAQNIDALVQNLAELRHTQDIQTRQVILAIAKKLLPDYTARNGLSEIEAVLDGAIREMAREPRLVVRVSEQQFDTVNERAQAIATQRAYAGKVIVLVDAEVAPGNCRVEWADGGIERNTQATWDAVEHTINPSV